MLEHKFNGGLLRVDHDYFFESRYVCFTFLNIEVDKDSLSKSVHIGFMGLHFTLVWS